MDIPRIKSSDPRLNPSSKTFCEKCSTRDGLNFAYANGKPIFLCERHYREWVAEANRNPELVRQQPFKQVGQIGDNMTVEQIHGKQEKRVY
jgi:hypothetical protein